MSLYLDGVPDLRALSGGRELDNMPWHFTVVNVESRINMDDARRWIWKNLEGRFCTKAGSHFNNWVSKIGFEDPMEASAYLLSQPLISTDAIDLDAWT
jgi:hypothetical protein